MNKYEKKFKQVEKFSSAINEFELNLLLFELKHAFKRMDKDNYKQYVTNDFCLVWLLSEFANFSSKDQNYWKKKVIDKINPNWLYGQFLRLLCNDLLNENYEFLYNYLKSFVALNLVSEAKVVKRCVQDAIQIITTTQEKITFSHIPLEKHIIDEYRGNCHGVISAMMKLTKKDNQNVAVVLEDNELYGKGYHSVIVDDNIMYDFAHNIMMPYENYIKLVEPEVLVYKQTKDILLEIKQLEYEKDFRNSEYVDLLKYGISKQLKK